jgi:hypothetical protein
MSRSDAGDNFVGISDPRGGLGFQIVLIEKSVIVAGRSTTGLKVPRFTPSLCQECEEPPRWHGIESGSLRSGVDPGFWTSR